MTRNISEERFCIFCFHPNIICEKIHNDLWQIHCTHCNARGPETLSIDSAWLLYELHAVNGEEAKRLFLYENGNNKDTCGNYFYTSDELDNIKGKNS